jgi:predicted nucleic acid-binding Zn ribbon protein
MKHNKTISINENEFKTLVKKIVNESVKRVLKESSEDEGFLRNWFGRGRNAGQQQNMVQAQPNSMQQGTGGKCPKCGNPIKQGASFCNQCGYNVTGQAKFCRNCGAPINQGQNYCRKCGKPLGQTQNLQEELKISKGGKAYWAGYYYAYETVRKAIQNGQKFAIEACRKTQGQLKLLKALNMTPNMNEFYDGEIEGLNDFIDNIDNFYEKSKKACEIVGKEYINLI